MTFSAILEGGTGSFCLSGNVFAAPDEDQLGKAEGYPVCPSASRGVKLREDYDGKDDVTVLSRRALFRQGLGGVDTVLPFTERERPAGEKFYYASAETRVLGLEGWGSD